MEDKSLINSSKTMTGQPVTYNEGQRISVPGEDFMVTKVSPVGNGDYIIQTRGLSELVKDKSYTFDTYLEDDIRIVNPTE